MEVNIKILKMKISNMNSKLMIKNLQELKASKTILKDPILKTSSLKRNFHFNIAELNQKSWLTMNSQNLIRKVKT
jgi:hypothetical protein